jgi:FecR protein
MMALALLACSASPAFAQSLAAATARNVTGGVLVVVRADGVEARLRGRGALRVFEGDTLRVDGAGRALVETDEGIQLALNGNAAAKLVSRWEKGSPVTRILRVERGEVWARVDDGQRTIEIETPVGILAARSAEVSVKLVSDSEAVATVVKGTADFVTPFASCQIRTGSASSAQRGKACTPPAAAEIRPITGWSHPLLAQ